MKKNILLFACLFTTTVACNDFLELEPLNSISANAYYKNANDVAAGLVACYDGLQTTVQNEFVLTEIRSDNTTTRLGEGDFAAIDAFTESSTNSITATYWANAYNTIMRTNVVLDHLNKVENEAQQKQIEGESKFIRALMYFNLVRLFGPIPLITTKVGYSDSDKFAKKPESDVYNLIIQDLEAGVAGMAPANSTSVQFGRATNGAAKALLAKVHLTLKNYGMAKTLLEDLIDDSYYTLLPNYADVFTVANEANKELIFSIRFKGASNGEGQVFTDEFKITGTFGGLNNATSTFYNSFSEADKRRAVNFEATSPYFPAKYKTAETRFDASADWPVLRYADVLLMYAEVLNELESSGINGVTLAPLNAVRIRAGLTPYKLEDVSDQNDLRNKILEERRFELAVENNRWFDLLRTNRAIAAIKAQDPNSNISEAKLTYAIPQREVDTSGGIITN